MFVINFQISIHSTMYDIIFDKIDTRIKITYAFVHYIMWLDKRTPGLDAQEMKYISLRDIITHVTYTLSLHTE